MLKFAGETLHALHMNHEDMVNLSSLHCIVSIKRKAQLYILEDKVAKCMCIGCTICSMGNVSNSKCTVYVYLNIHNAELM